MGTVHLWKCNKFLDEPTQVLFLFFFFIYCMIYHFIIMTDYLTSKNKP